MDVSRIKNLGKDQGKSYTYLCKLINRPKYYLNDVAKSDDNKISDEDLRTLAIELGTSVEYLKGETDDPHFRVASVGMTTLPYEGQKRRPVFGHASAGLGVYAQQETIGLEEVDPEYASEDYFWLQVEGDSMAPVINDKDLVLVERGVPLETGSIMVVIVDDEDGYVKKVSIDDDTLWLHSFNPYYPPMEFSGSDLGRIRCVGKVVELKRKF